jgi:hypothetical protein
MVPEFAVIVRLKWLFSSGDKAWLSVNTLPRSNLLTGAGALLRLAIALLLALPA